MGTKIRVKMTAEIARVEIYFGLDPVSADLPPTSLSAAPEELRRYLEALLAIPMDENHVIDDFDFRRRGGSPSSLELWRARESGRPFEGFLGIGEVPGSEFPVEFIFVAEVDGELPDNDDNAATLVLRREGDHVAVSASPWHAAELKERAERRAARDAEEAAEAAALARQNAYRPTAVQLEIAAKLGTHFGHRWASQWEDYQKSVPPAEDGGEWTFTPVPGLRSELGTTPAIGELRGAVRYESHEMLGIEAPEVDEAGNLYREQQMLRYRIDRAGSVTIEAFAGTGCRGLRIEIQISQSGLLRCSVCRKPRWREIEAVIGPAGALGFDRALVLASFPLSPKELFQLRLNELARQTIRAAEDPEPCCGENPTSAQRAAGFRTLGNLAIMDGDVLLLNYGPGQATRPVLDDVFPFWCTIRIWGDHDWYSYEDGPNEPKYGYSTWIAAARTPFEILITEPVADQDGEVGYEEAWCLVDGLGGNESSPSWMGNGIDYQWSPRSQDGGEAPRVRLAKSPSRIALGMAREALREYIFDLEGMSHSVLALMAGPWRARGIQQRVAALRGY